MQFNLKIAAVHPTLVNLQTAREVLAAASSTHHLHKASFIDATRKIDPHIWTRAIEKSLLSEEGGELLRLDYEELAITWLSALLKQRYTSHLLRDARVIHHSALQQLATSHDTIGERSPEGWIKQYLRAAFVICSQESVEENPQPSSRPQEQPEIPDSVDVRAKRIFVKVFEAFVQDLSTRIGPHNGHYATESAVPAGPYRPSPVNGFRVRALFAVPLDHQDSLPINAQLYEQLQVTEELAKVSKGAQKQIAPYAPPGKDLYEATLLNTLCNLDGPKALEPGCANVVATIRRRHEENLRSSIFFEHSQLARREFTNEYEKLIKLLIAATAEATEFIGNSRQSGYREFSHQVNWNFWIVMNNCLVADFKLREYGAQLKPFVDPARAYDSREDVSREFERLVLDFRKEKPTVKS